MINWIKKNKIEFIFLLVVLVIALFLRLFRINEFMTFLGDEGRDVRIVRDLLTEGNLVFIGPQTSVGNMYLGPLYYYMMAPALFLSRFNPVGPAIMVALISVLTVFFTWYVTRNWFGKVAASISLVLYAVSPIAIIYGRTSWNPNPMPFFALLCVWGVYQIWQKNKFFWLPVVGISAAFALQMHYLALLLLPTIALFWYLTLRKLGQNNSNRNQFTKQSILAIILFLLL
jgi:4-amino-4-deoxy-L-arabinose transferase-like glycosyltransferase